VKRIAWLKTKRFFCFFLDNTRKKFKKSIDELMYDLSTKKKAKVNLKLCLNSEYSKELEGLKYAYNNWLKSAKINGTLNPQSLQLHGVTTEDYSLVSTKYQPLIFNTGDICFYFYFGVILAIDVKGHFITAIKPQGFQAGLKTFTKAEYSSDIPGDAKIVGDTWQHVRKDGKRDLRYGANDHYFFVQYCNLSIKLSEYDYEFKVSNERNCVDLVNSINLYNKLRLKLGRSIQLISLISKCGELTTTQRLEDVIQKLNLE
jgi:hypothetical protein